MIQPKRQCVIVVNNTAAPANSGSGAAAKIGIIGRCPKFFAGRVCYTLSGAPETPPIIPRLSPVEKMLVINTPFPTIAHRGGGKSHAFVRFRLQSFCAALGSRKLLRRQIADAIDDEPTRCRV